MKKNHCPTPAWGSIALIFSICADAAPPPAQLVTVEDPCKGVSIALESSGKSYEEWRRDWLSVDWGQICRYRAENASLPPSTAQRVVFLGDSITEGWIQSDPGFFHLGRLDRGIGGQTTPQMLVRLRADVLDLHPAVVHIMAGTNDIAGNTGPTSLSWIQGNIASMVEQVRAHGARVIIASIPPAAQLPWREGMRPAATIVTMNEWLRQYAAREGVIYADYYAVLDDGYGGLKHALSDDGVHPNAAGYAVMRPIAEAALKRALHSQASVGSKTRKTRSRTL